MTRKRISRAAAELFVGESRAARDAAADKLRADFEHEGEYRALRALFEGNYGPVKRPTTFNTSKAVH